MRTEILLLLCFLLLNLALDFIVELLNLSRLSNVVPASFQDVYTSEKYAKAQEYLRVSTRFHLLETAFGALVLMFTVAFGLFDVWDLALRAFVDSEVLRGLLFVGGITFVSGVLSLPFNLYSTFVIEERFGFNRTTLRTFIVDRVKSIVLGLLVGAPVLWAFFEIWVRLGSSAWIWAWVLLVSVQLFMMFIAPVTIMPLFNKFQPLPAGALRSEIEKYAAGVKFKMQGIFTMDGSKRSTKANAFFTGFGRFRRIVLFDTLIEKHSERELLAVLAHEVGHYKMKHVFRQLYLSVAVTGVTLFLMSLFSSHPLIFSAFNMSQPSFYAGLMFFGILYSPISMLISIYSLYLSRKYEFEADEYSRRTFGDASALATALKKLSADNLSNLNPHPLKVFLEYTHPPVLQRIEKLSHVGQ
jgi:STE24 endopeptidase